MAAGCHLQFSSLIGITAFFINARPGQAILLISLNILGNVNFCLETQLRFQFISAMNSQSEWIINFNWYRQNRPIDTIHSCHWFTIQHEIERNKNLQFNCVYLMKTVVSYQEMCLFALTQTYISALRGAMHWTHSHKKCSLFIETNSKNITL